MVRHVVFVGPMGSGKSTIGIRVATALGRPFLDNDALLEAQTGMSAATLAERDGADALHRVEASVLLAALGTTDGSVVAAAASTIEDAAVRDALRDACVVWVRADPGVLAARLPSPTRPFGERDPAELVAEQSPRRDALFASVADGSFDTGTESIDVVVARILVWLDEVGRAPAHA